MKPAETVTKEASCTEKGEKTAKCSRCTETRTQEIAALGHRMSAWTVDPAATCTADGKKDQRKTKSSRKRTSLL